MGAGWRRVKEQVKQNWNLTDKNFVATSNSRNENMLREAGEFASHLKRCEKEIRTLKNATEGLLSATKLVMTAPLPRVYDEGPGGKAVPQAPAPGQPTNIGGDFRVEELLRISKETSKKLEAEVLAPMARWTSAYTTVQGRMKRLEGVRLEVDSRRHTVAALGGKIEAQRARLPQTRSKGEFQMEQTIRKMQHKENKLAASRQSFKEQEGLVNQQLAQLIRDGVWLKSYLAAVMRLEAEAFQQAHAALGAKAALPLLQPDAVAITADAGISRPLDAPSQGLGTARSLPGAAKRAAVGKENGASLLAAGHIIGGTGKTDYGADLPAAPVHPLASHRRGDSRGYDRYGEAAQHGPQAAWG